MTSEPDTEWKLSGERPSNPPLYLQVAGELMAQIAAGVFPVGSRLPTEMQLCGRYNLSRHTIREALRRLQDVGLVSRRRGSGTEVIAATPQRSYVQPISSIEDLLQYGENTKVRVHRKAHIVCNKTLASMLECEEGREWLWVETIRERPGDAVRLCVTTVYLDAGFAGLDDRLLRLSGPISALMERHYGVRITRIDQTIQAVATPKRIAKLLGVEVGSPALRAVRRYYDESNNLIECADAIHPGERFTYVTNLLRS